jgi:hypothetical protein
MTMDPRILYRGYLPNVANMGGCTLIQFVANGKLKNMVTGGEVRDLSAAENMATGFGAGAVSAFAGSPLELLMIQAQVKGGSLVARAQELGLSSVWGRGFWCTVMREGIWSVGYLAFPPIFNNLFRTTWPETFTSEDRARFPAAAVGGAIACTLSMPFDTCKTCMQGDVERVKFGTMTNTFRTLAQESGVLGFFRGIMWRYSRQVVAICLLDKTRQVQCKTVRT